MPRPPVVFKKILWRKDPFETYCAFKGKGPSVLLESVRRSAGMGRYSLTAKEPFLIFESKNKKVLLRTKSGAKRLEAHPFEVLKRLLRKFQSAPFSGFPPFAGGAVGYFAYECKNILEPCLLSRVADDIGLPETKLLFFDEGILWDHAKKQTYLFSRTKKTLAVFEKKLRASFSAKKTLRRKENFQNIGEIRSSLDRENFVRIVKKAKRYIEEGEIFQVNLSQRLSFPIPGEAEQIYAALKKSNPSSFFGIFDAGDFQIISGSPERLLKLENGILETRPIAGTRPRGKNRREDARASIDLLLNEKERAEHLMLVDLERNDLGRVCEYGSVAVNELMTVENYARVKHIVSNVRGVLRKDMDAVDALKAFFPGGTITGTPKIRSMQVIDELEPVARGPYTGSLGYFSFTGNMDFNIIIRSLVIKDQKAHLHVGAGIVADSIPEKEYDETLYKAEGVLHAVFGRKKTAHFLRRCGVKPRRA